MRLDYGRNFKFLRIVGCCIATLIVYRMSAIAIAYQPGMMNPVSLSDLCVLALSTIIVFYCLTAYWRVEFRPDQVVSEYGFPLWRNSKSYRSIKNIEFKVDFIEVKNGPDKAYIRVDLSVHGRERPYPVCSLYQARGSMFFMEDYFKKRHNTEILKFKSDANRLRCLYPQTTITLDEKVASFYESMTSEVFPWN
ncbi:hypothetical protein [Vibrio sp. HN007]|uniref:hypothetical protein n=1 Tax=Vibrio iocasae TaxID=3098914 RepID=UPI0035D3D9CD